MNNSSFCSHILSAIDSQCHVFPFEKLSLRYPSLSVNGIFDEVRYDYLSVCPFSGQGVDATFTVTARA